MEDRSPYEQVQAILHRPISKTFTGARYAAADVVDEQLSDLAKAGFTIHHNGQPIEVPQ